MVIFRWIMIFHMYIILFGIHAKCQTEHKESSLKSTENKQSTFEENTYGPTIKHTDRFTMIFDFTGYIFNETGVTYSINAQIATALVFSFSPNIEENVAKKFVDPAKQNVFFANSPALKWYNDSFILVCRIWLDKEKYLDQKNFPYNSFNDNYLYTQRFDDKLHPLTKGRLITIPLNKAADIGDGPIEPRLHILRHHLYTTFNAAILFPWGQKLDWTMIYDYDQDMTYVPSIKGGSPVVMETAHGVPRDKHWMSLVQNDQLYFVHNLDPLNIMKCTKEGKCEFIHQVKFQHGFLYNEPPYIGHLRGGTPFEHYNGNYYISFAHNTLVKSLTHRRHYSVHLIVLRTNPYRICYVSDDLQIHERIFENAPQVRNAIDDNFLFPVSLHIETNDSFIIGAHINDHSAVLIRIRGMKELMEAIIHIDQDQPLHHGPPAGVIRDYIRNVVIKQTKVDMLDN